MDDDIGLLSSSSSVTSVTCSSKKSHLSVDSATAAIKLTTTASGQQHQQHVSSCSFVRRCSSPSFISSLSRSDTESTHTNRTSINNDSVSSSNSSVFTEEKPLSCSSSSTHSTSNDNKLLKADNINRNSRHRTSFSDDYDSEFNSICNLSKLKLKQEETNFLNLIHECQVWIEVNGCCLFVQN
jgi:hypothetical protein